MRSLSSPSSGFSDDGDFTFPNLSPSPPSLDHLTSYHPQKPATYSNTDHGKHWMIDYFDEWMQPAGFEFHLDAPEDQIAWVTAAGDPGQLYGEGAFASPFPANFPQQTPQQSGGSHRRLPSSSSVASAADSPFPHPALPLQQYPATYTQPAGFSAPQPAVWPNDAYSPSSAPQHLPTPTGTPTSDTHSLPAHTHPRRAKPAASQQAALAAAHNSVRLALNQQWHPRTHTQSHTQTQSLSFADMPRTPVTVNGDDGEGQQFGAVPKFNRTVSDAQADELYNPSSYGQPSAAVFRSQPLNSVYLQPQQTMLQERLTAANEARSSSPSSPSRHASPFRKSPYTTESAAYNQQSVAGAMPDNDFSGASGAVFQKQAQQGDAKESKTVSPKDTFPGQPLSGEENFTSLFPSESSQPVQYAPHNAPTSDLSAFTTLGGQSWSFQATSMPTNANALDVKPENMPQGPLYGPVYSSNSGHGNYLPPNLASMETTKSEDSEEASEDTPEMPAQRPADTSASSSRYTCPYKNDASGWQCNERFDDPMELNKHKKEAHRPSGAQADRKSSKLSQAGPHKCTKINPSTGKVCDTVFSRPYDLTRHEDTIHGERKKTRCPYCAEEKLFSRGDALTRHLRVVHSNMPQNPGRQRGRRSLA